MATNKCMFCSKMLEKGKIFHEDEECKSRIKLLKKEMLENERITVGLATCGISAGALDTLNSIKDSIVSSQLNIQVDEVGCSGMCFNEPVVTVRITGSDGNVHNSIYSNLTADKVPELISAIKSKTRLKKDFAAERLEEIDYFKKQTRVIMKRCGITVPHDLKQYIATDGFKGLINAVKQKPEEVIEVMKKSGLRGRGGAGFSTGMKWDFLAKAKGKKYLVINADEGDPGAFMNRTLMESDPFQILEGLLIASYATGAKQGIIYTRAEYPLAVATLQKAIDILYANSLLGKSILGIDSFDFEVRIMKGAGAFVCGEETALIRSLEGRRGHPRPRPPYPAEKGYFDHPTNINNVESYAHAANILAEGIESYSQLGSHANTGTKCICLAGKIMHPGVIEVPLGIKLRELIYDIGGGIKNKRKFKAVQSGGPSGGCIVERELDTPLDFDNIPKTGAIMGSGGLVVMDEDDCMVDVAKFFLTFTTDESCGKCTPCREGTKRMLELVDKISKGIASEKDLDKLKVLARVIKDTALCGLGQTAPNPVLSTVEKFADEYLAHIQQKKCPTHRCTDLVKYVVTEKCKGCGNCERNCPTKCITGKLKEKYIIAQEKCIKCGKCYKVCAFKAIDRV